ncbi:TetR family transcriptional regulator C-terminal domain-containing protein, partial [Klebsiella pneumoniae]|uniref:TetR family transcriptional regulator C-terminal domain-containing protein n=1 Tax=Klebsiella pneumoniae TaxID=573 RepID=UPI003D6C1763
LLDAVMDGYANQPEWQPHSAPPEDRNRLRAVIIQTLRDIQTFQTTHLFPELWSMANHDPEVDQRIQEFYRRARAWTQQLLQRLNPALSERDAETLCIFFSSFAEGSTIFAGHGKDYA